MKHLGLSFSATLTLLIILIATKSNGQIYAYEQILGKADSMVRTQVPGNLLKYFNRDSALIKYDFRRAHWRKYLNRQGEIGKGENTKGYFQYALIYYNFHFKEPVINADLHKGYLTYFISVLFDSQLNPRFRQDDPNDFNFNSPGQTHVDLSFIPAYVRENRPCDFVSMEKAIEIGKQANIKKGIEPLAATLDYDGGDLKRYCWWINSPLTREKHDDHIHGEADTVTIDAVTGEVISHDITTYGAMH